MNHRQVSKPVGRCPENSIPVRKKTGKTVRIFCYNIAVDQIEPDLLFYSLYKKMFGDIWNSFTTKNIGNSQIFISLINGSYFGSIWKFIENKFWVRSRFWGRYLEICENLMVIYGPGVNLHPMDFKLNFDLSSHFYVAFHCPIFQIRFKFLFWNPVQNFTDIFLFQNIEAMKNRFYIINIGK